MELRRLTQIAAASATLTLALAAAPAFAHDVPHGAPPQPAPVQGNYSHEMMSTEAREAWLAECNRRMSHHGSRAPNRGQCEAYLDDYYAHYSKHKGPGHYSASYGYPAACCRPMMMVPVMKAPKVAPKCKETVEYEYVDVPVKPAPRPVPAPVPQKRVKVVPDKRIPAK